MDHIGLSIRRLRLSRNWTAAALCDRCEFTVPSTISRIERGFYNPTLDTLADIAGAFGMTDVDLLIYAGHESTVEGITWPITVKINREDIQHG